MKRTASILLILTLTVTLFYNAIGYYLMYAFEKEQAWVNTMQKIPNHEFNVLKLNATLYAFTDDTEMEYVNENVTVNNVTYHIFKKQIRDNILNLYYLRNHHQDNINKNLKALADDELFNTSHSKMPIKKLLKAFSNDYVCFEMPFVANCISKNATHTNPFICTNSKTLSGYLASCFSPPDFC
ncbi:hypothetical protein [Flavobacterium branchiophilum]|uniref:Uncharacterized protein n=1 Tax=Flavobacterium branchiophilum TaxID=55197 RepID=A0A2H3KD98_9FLAO|nr:hypothetical protein [Flavobacterium branchiophilum]PDS25572.1 hypothetical protein B0A77_04590 [Flavobacterium branchiophilum]